MHLQFSQGLFTKRWVRILLLAMLASLAFVVTLSQFTYAPGNDFYQYWAVGTAQRNSAHPLGNPYVAMRQYDGILRDVAQSSTDLRLQKVWAERQQLELYQTPLCFLLFAYLPTEYSLSFAIFWALSIASFLAAVILLSSVYHGDRFWFLLLAFLLIIYSFPMYINLYSGNLACLQFFGLALSLWLAHRLLNHNNFIVLTACAFLCLQVFLILLKPNLLPVSLLLGVHFWKRHGFRFLVPAAWASVSFGIILMILPCLSFHSWTIWYDWFKCLGGIDNQSLLAWINTGNFAPATLLSKTFGIGISAALAGLAAGIFICMMTALMLATSPGDRGLGGWGRALGRALNHSDLCASFGVITMLALSPMVWIHYYLLTLLPSLWLISRPGRKMVNLFGYLNILLASGWSLKFVTIFSWRLWIAADLFALNLAFLLAGVLAMMASGKIWPPDESSHLEWQKSAGA